MTPQVIHFLTTLSVIGSAVALAALHVVPGADALYAIIAAGGISAPTQYALNKTAPQNPVTMVPQ